MTATKYYFPSRIIEAMGIPFIIKLATKNYDEVTQDIFHQTCYSVEKEIAEIIEEPYPFRGSSLISEFQNNNDDSVDYDTFQSVIDQVKISSRVTNQSFLSHKLDEDSHNLLKGWTIERIFEKDLRPLLSNSEISGISLGGSGDMRVATKKDDDFYWKIGIKNPGNPQMMTGYYLKNGAVSTSVAEKSNSYNSIQQVTVFSNDLVGADIWSVTGASVGMEKFSRIIWKSKLTGILFDCNQGGIPFRDGILGRA